MAGAAALARAQALACWDSREVVDITHVGDIQDDIGLGEGRTNQNFIATVVSAGKRERYFVRIGSDLPAYGVSRAKEHAAARSAELAGIGASVLYSELPDALVCAFVDGRSLTETEVKAACDGKDHELLEALCEALRRLHRTSMPPEVARMAPASAQWAPPDLDRWIKYSRDASFCRLPVLEDAEALVARLEKAAGPLDANSASFCHFDLLPDNFVCARHTDGPPTITIVDYEYCNAGQPLMDLAITSMGCRLSGAQESRLLCGYLQLDELSAVVNCSFAALKVLATLRETMWGVVAEVSGSSALPLQEAIRYTDSNYAKFLEAKARFDDMCRTQ